MLLSSHLSAIEELIDGISKDVDIHKYETTHLNKVNPGTHCGIQDLVQLQGLQIRIGCANSRIKRSF